MLEFTERYRDRYNYVQEHRHGEKVKSAGTIDNARSGHWPNYKHGQIFVVQHVNNNGNNVVNLLLIIYIKTHNYITKIWDRHRHGRTY